MIKIHFFDWESPDLDIEGELGADMDADVFLTQNIRGIRLDSTDNAADMENNTIYWFSSEDDEAKAAETAAFLSARKRDGGRLRFTITTETD